VSISDTFDVRRIWPVCNLLINNNIEKRQMWHSQCVRGRYRAIHARVHLGDRAMAAKAQLEQTPVGIIISQGTRVEDTPRFAAYIWGPAPTDAEILAATKAA
jgi:hypothetical protein